MASIVYVCEREMIEFHRLYGHRTMVFWRLSTKKFTQFSTNDFLFFYCKTNRKERGIVGMGRLKKIKNMSAETIFKQEKALCGFASLDELKSAIEKVNKTKKPIHKLNCLFLEEVTYFKTPIYLSDFKLKLSRQLESYSYIDQEDNITQQIIQSAFTSGLDLWSETQGKQTDQAILQHQLEIYQLAQQIKSADFLNTPRHKRMVKDILSLYPKSQVLPMNPGCAYYQNTIYIMMVNQLKKDTYSVYGLIQTIECKDPLQFCLVYQNQPSEEDIQLFKKSKVKLEILVLAKT